MTLAYRASGTFTDASFTNAGFAFPAGMADGDVLVLPVQVRGTGATATIDEDWLEAPGSPVIRSASFRTYFFYKYVPTAAGESTPTVTVTVSGAIRGRISAFSGGADDTQLDVAIVGTDGPAVTTITAPSITPVSNLAMVGWVFSTNDDATLATNTQGTLAYSSNGTAGSDGSLALVYELQGSPGASGTCDMTATTNAPVSTNVITFALRPAPVAATSPSTALFDDILFDVDVAFGAGPFTPSPTWTRVTDYLVADYPIEIETGRSSEDGAGNPATLTLALNNSIDQSPGRRFDPDYSAGPYYGQLNLRTPIRVWARRDGVDYALFTGHVSSWRQVQVAGSRDGYTAVSAVCVMRILSQTTLPGSQLAMAYMTDQPEVYLPMEEEALGPAVDLSGNGWGGRYSTLTQIQPSIVKSRPDAKAKGLDLSGNVGFDGTILNVAAGSAPENILTFEAWVKVTKIDSATLNAVGVVAPFTLDVQGVSNGLMLQARTDFSALGQQIHSWGGWLRDSTGVLTFGNGGIVSLNTTYHVCAVLEDTLQTFRFYINGQEQLPALDVSALSFESGSLTPSMLIQVSEDESGGIVQHVAAYQDALTADEVLRHYEAGIVGANLQTAQDRLDLLAEYAGLTDAGLFDATAMGTHTFLAPSDFSGSVLDEMRTIVEADQGRLFTDGYGVLTAQSRVTDIAPGETAHIVSQGTYGDSAPSEIRYEDFNREPASEDLLLNVVTINGTEYRDSSSVALYGPAAEDVSLPIADPVAARGYADSRLERHATPRPRIDRLTVNMRGHPTTELDTAINTTLGLNLGHRIVATIRPAAGLGDDVVEAVRVEGRKDVITRHAWTRDLYLVPAGDAYNEGPFYTIGHATYGRIGTSAGNKIPG